MVPALTSGVTEFVSALSEELAALSGRRADSHLADVSVEAANIVGGIIAADGRFSDSELDAYLDSVGPLLDPPLLISSATLREMDILRGKEASLAAPSVLFDLLSRADAKHGAAGPRHSHRYYELALRVAHLTAAADLVPSPDEIAAIDRFRTTMLQAMDAAGIERPGRRPPAAVPPAGLGARGGPIGSDAAPTEPAPTAAATAGESAVPVVEPPSDRSLDYLLADLDELIGLANVKAEVRRLTSLLQVQRLRAERGLPTMEISHHLVFTGNPGTGKTTVARLLGQIYHAVGVVSKGHLVETDRSKLVAGYVGQTALKTAETLNAALGGMLLIDEAYALARGGDNDFGREAIDTLVKFMEDHRDDLAIVAAGYTAEMADFIDTNPGLKSRFTRTVSFPDYTDDELFAIFTKLAEKNGYTCSDDAAEMVRHRIGAEPRTRGFGNARFVRNLFETAVSHQAMRLSPLTDPSNEQLGTFVASDIAAVDA
jgi:Holliday junction resolvasome RuvABC ATP-dependent DNA helicase subunit